MYHYRVHSNAGGEGFTFTKEKALEAAEWEAQLGRIVTVQAGNFDGEGKIFGRVFGVVELRPCDGILDIVSGRVTL